jgi:hypothetical protein
MQGVALCNPLAAELIPEPVEGVEAKDTLSYAFRQYRFLLYGLG